MPAVRGTVVTTYLGGSTVVEHSLYASIIGQSTSYMVFLPAGYNETYRRYPVLYMLHGVAGDATEWQSIGLLEAADRMIQDGEIEPMLIVLPNGGANYWVNHAAGARWGDYLVGDVVASVDREYRTVAGPRGARRRRAFDGRRGRAADGDAEPGRVRDRGRAQPVAPDRVRPALARSSSACTGPRPSGAPPAGSGWRRTPTPPRG